MKMTIYGIYGTLAHEKRPVFTDVKPSGNTPYIAENVSIPDEIIAGKNEDGELILSLGGTQYLLREALTNAGDTPVLRWYDGRGYQTVSIKA